MKVTLSVQQYVASPYWPALEKVVSIQKQSGCNRARSEDKKESALLRYLEKSNITHEQYQELVTASKRPWYRHTDGRIIIPAHQLEAALVQASHSAPAGARVASDQLRSLIRVSDFVTAKTDKDRLFERFILPKDGKGNPLSNQRRYTVDEVIENFQASGELNFDAGDVKPKQVLDLLKYCGKYCGVGGCRKMGYGRFSVEEV